MVKNLFTLNRKIGDEITAYCPTFDMDELQARIKHIIQGMQKEFGSVIEITSFSGGLIYSFSVDCTTFTANYFVQSHSLDIK